jgi:hypothetical protein
MPPLNQLQRSSGLVDVLDRVLDRGLVVAGDVKISLAEVELITIRIRLVICSIDKAQSIGLDWWRGDPYFTGDGRRIERGAGSAGDARARGGVGGHVGAPHVR